MEAEKLDLKKGVDFIGNTCVFFCHDGDGNLLLAKRSANCRDEQGRWDWLVPSGSTTRTTSFTMGSTLPSRGGRDPKLYKSMKKVISIFSLMTLMLLPLAGSAAVFEADDSVTISEAHEDDVYVAGAMVNVTAPISGDVFIGGANVNVSGAVSEDLFIVGSNVNITGDVGGDLRVVGSNITINADIGDDVMAGGAMVHFVSGTIGGDLIVGARVVIIDGNITGDLIVSGEEVVVNGSIAGDIVGEIKKLKIAEGAIVMGSVDYKSSVIADIAEGAHILGEVIKSDAPEESEASVIDIDEDAVKAVIGGFLGTIMFIKLIAAILVGLLLVLAAPTMTKGMVRSVSKKPGLAFLRGFLLYLAAPIVIIVLFSTLIGYPFAIATMAFCMLIWMISLGFSGVLLGSWVFQLAKKQQKPIVTWVSAVTGTVLLGLVVVLIPFLGWIAGCVISAMATGAALELLYKKVREIS